MKLKLDQKKRAALSVLALSLALLITGSLAWQDLSQHKTNNFQTASLEHSVTLVKTFETVLEWVEGESIVHAVSVRNGDASHDPSLLTYDDAYIRIQFREFMEIGTRTYLYSDHRYMIDTQGNFITFETLSEAQAFIATVNQGLDTDLPEQERIVLLSGFFDVDDAGDAVSYYYIRSQAHDPNGQYGRFLVLDVEDVNMESVHEGKENQSGSASTDHNAQPDDNPEYQEYTIKGWDDASLEASPFLEYIAWELGTAVITFTEWFEDYDAEPVPMWIIDDTNSNGWIYWGSPLKHSNEIDVPQTMTPNFLERVTLIHQPMDTANYQINTVMDAVSQDDLDAWSESNWVIKEMLKHLESPKVRFVELLGKLQDLVNEGNAIEASTWDTITYTELAQELAKGQEVLDTISVDDISPEHIETVTHAYNTLNDAMKLLKKLDPLYRELRDLITQVNTIDTSAWDSTLQEEAANALINGTAVYNAGDRSNDALTVLQEAIDALKAVAAINPYYAQLMKHVSDAQNILNGHHIRTEKVWDTRVKEAFESAISNAQNVLNNTSRTDISDTTTDVLKAEIDALKLKAALYPDLNECYLALKAVLDTAKATDISNWDDASKASLSAAITTGQALYDAGSIDASTVTHIETAIAAIQGVEGINVYYAQLKNTLDTANAINITAWDTVTKSAMQSAISTAQTVYNNANNKDVSNSTSTTLQNAISALNTTSARLQEINPLYVSLRSLVASKTAVDVTNWDSASKASMSAAITNGQSVLTGADTSTTAKAKLESAIAQLNAVEGINVYYAQLKSALDTANAINITAWDNVTKPVMQSAISAAQTVYNNASNKDVSNSTSTILQNAISALNTTSTRLQEINPLYVNLRSLVSTKNAVDLTNWDSASKSSMSTAITNGQSVLTGADTSTTAKAKLESAISQLNAVEGINVYYAQLKSALDTANAINITAWDAVTKSAMQSAISTAQTVYTNASNKDVSNGTSTTLQNAITALSNSTILLPQLNPLYVNLSSALTAANSINTSSWNTTAKTYLTNAISTAQTVYNNANITTTALTTVSNATTTLSDAVTLVQSYATAYSSLQTQITTSNAVSTTGWASGSITAFTTLKNSANSTLSSATSVTSSAVTTLNNAASTLNTNRTNLVNMNTPYKQLVTLLTNNPNTAHWLYTTANATTINNAISNANSIQTTVNAYTGTTASTITSYISTMNTRISELTTALALSKQTIAIGNTVTFAGRSFRVLAIRNGNALIAGATALKTDEFTEMGISYSSSTNGYGSYAYKPTTPYITYESSRLKNLDTAFYNTYIATHAHDEFVQPVTWGEEVYNSSTWQTRSDQPTTVNINGTKKAFSLSASDFNYYSITSSVGQLTGWNVLLRSPGQDKNSAVQINNANTLITRTVTSSSSLVNPALWVSID